MPKGRGSDVARGNKRFRSRRNRNKNVKIHEFYPANQRKYKKREPMGNIARLLKGMHKRGRGKNETLFKGDYNLIEFVKNQKGK